MITIQQPVSIYSNFFPSPFVQEGTFYNCVEQKYQHELCLFFKDPQAAKHVMLQSDPVAMKYIGDKLVKSNPERYEMWKNNRAKIVMKDAVLRKFVQNPAICTYLKTTSGIFVEANEYDKDGV